MTRSGARAGCRLAALGIATALGVTPEETAARLTAGDGTRLTERDDLVPGRSLAFGQVHEALPAVAARLDVGKDLCRLKWTKKHAA